MNNEEYELAKLRLERKAIPDYDDDMIREMLKGKPAAYRKRLLKEIEMNKQR
jgi:hypothetical protein